MYELIGVEASKYADVYVEAAVSLCPTSKLGYTESECEHDCWWCHSAKPPRVGRIETTRRLCGSCTPSYLALAGLEQPGVYVEAAVSLCPTSKLSYTESECEHVCWRCHSAKSPRVGRIGTTRRLCGSCSQSLSYVKVELHGK
ncbi:hypothetical protein J6590_031028 [Homalodisca vitripennis]|nr:hypothetical protein J6590_031028 [Homalodisca vitripennis]